MPISVPPQQARQSSAENVAGDTVEMQKAERVPKRRRVTVRASVPLLVGAMLVAAMLILPGANAMDASNGGREMNSAISSSVRFSCRGREHGLCSAGLHKVLRASAFYFAAHSQRRFK